MLSASPWGLPTDDLADSNERTVDDVAAWRGARILMTGGTGFLGRWLVASLVRAIDRFDLDIRLDVLSRNPVVPEIEPFKAVTVLQGDVREFNASGTYDLIIHGAASSSAAFGIGDGDPTVMATTIVDGTKRIIDAASRSRARLLFLSSGAVYGAQLSPVAETALTGPDPLDPASAYGQAKRLAETLCAVATGSQQIDAVIARLFAFVGPGIPLRAHYAAGNFLDAALEGKALSVRGDGRPIRSYLYCGDLAEWCWALISRGLSGRAYNVGSPDPISIWDLAERISKMATPKAEIEVLGSPGVGPAPCYVPVTDLASRELGLDPRTSLDEALERTFSWLSARQSGT